MDYLSVKETAGRWGVTERRVQQLCKAGRIPGAAKFGKSWMVPKDAKLPTEEEKAMTEMKAATATPTPWWMTGRTVR